MPTPEQTAMIYLDNNATTQPAPQVVQAMLPFLTQWWANPSSVHRFGQQARQAIDQARASLAGLLNCADSELLFTGGGTEASNLALRGLLAARAPRKKIVISTVEHSATRELCQTLAQSGFQIIEIGVNTQGELNEDELDAALRDDTAGNEVALVSLLWANNETGVLFPVDRVAERCRARRVPFHCDATQAVGKLPCDARALGFDLATIAPHKFHGPKGVGVLYVRRGLRISPLIVGGPQERGRRGGTENVPGIVGAGVAAELARAHLPDMPRLARLRDHLEQSILHAIPETSVNGRTDLRLPNTTNIGFARLQAEAILLLLSEQDICASAGAACSSGSLEPSHVLQAMRVDPKVAHGSIRFSLSRNSNETEIQQVLQRLPGLIARLRKVLPI